MAWLSNPVAFSRGPVTIISTLIYIAIIAVLIVIHTTVPSSPSKSPKGLNLTEAWHDLQLLSSSYHPYNSRQNEVVHDWLLTRVHSIIRENKAASVNAQASSPAAYVFDDQSANLTFSSEGVTILAGGISVYFEGTNIIVYIQGSEDDPSEWWKQPRGKPSSRNAVLVNAHIDSVASGYGATDDGMGVVSILQLLRYYTTSGHTPKNGLVLLLNNGEEDFLNGARVFAQHPMSRIVSTFLNLEGAGAGGRATLFRSTDAGVTRAYAQSPSPFGTVISADGFQRGLIRSQTDYVIFNGVFGYRGLDMAFMEPRARYHTNQDSSIYASRNSLWHMLSAALATTKELTNGSYERDGGTRSVWFDVLGQAFAVFQAHTLFALSVTSLVVAPVVLFVTLIILYRTDKLYLLSGSTRFLSRDGNEVVHLYGWRGFSRFPFIFLFACAAPVALAYLLFKENPFIAHSSQWAVWCMMFSSFIFVAWFIARFTSYVRPSALTRAYGLTWMCVAWWAFLVAGTIFEQQMHVAGSYSIFIYYTSVAVATWLSYLELFSLPRKSTYCINKLGEEAEASSRSISRSRHSDIQEGEDDRDEDEANERTSLLHSGRTTFRHMIAPGDNEDPSSGKEAEKDHPQEQEWSTGLWSWMWLLELVVLAPINLILIGQIGLLLVSGLHQTGADGSSTFLVYIGIAIISIFVLSPLVPILHRFTWHVPIFLLLVLIATLIYNLIAFPFSSNNRLKLFFQQEVNLNAATNNVTLYGAPGYVQQAVAGIPTSAGQDLHCEPYRNLARCSWTGTLPELASSESASPFISNLKLKNLLSYNVTRLSNSSDITQSARFHVSGTNTRACVLRFDEPISSFSVEGQSTPDRRMPPVSEHGSSEIRLWSRTWDRTWTVDVTWADVSDVRRATHGDRETNRERVSKSGRVVCLWSDVNQRGVIPAYDEAEHFVPEWAAVTKGGDGLVEGYKDFKI